MTLEEKEIRRIRFEAEHEIYKELVRLRDESNVPFRFGFCYDRQAALFDAAELVYEKALDELEGIRN